MFIINVTQNLKGDQFEKIKDCNNTICSIFNKNEKRNNENQRNQSSQCDA